MRKLNKGEIELLEKSTQTVISHDGFGTKIVTFFTANSHYYVQYKMSQSQLYVFQMYFILDEKEKSSWSNDFDTNYKHSREEFDIAILLYEKSYNADDIRQKLENQKPELVDSALDRLIKNGSIVSQNGKYSLSN